MKKIEAIAIVGMRCSGKTTVGTELAARLDAPFADTDRLVEERLGASVEEMFGHGREAEFRKVEEDVCIDALKHGGVVVLGGGSITSERVRRALWSVMTIFLDASEHLIAARLETNHRPSLTGQAPAIEAAEISRMRRPWYLDVADFVIHVDGKNVGQVCDEIVKCIHGFEEDEE